MEPNCLSDMFSLEPVSIGSVPVVTWTELTATVVVGMEETMGAKGNTFFVLIVRCS